MIQKLNNLMIQETDAVGTLLKALEEQHRCIVVNDIFGLEACVKTIKDANKDIAFIEVSRRQLIENKTMNSIIEESHDKELENNYYKIQHLLEEVVLQKDTNELLIKQGLSFTNRILNVLNPARETKTYNAYGKIKK
jgi:flagellar biosynthesis/type III secretory pathway chaperone